MEKLMACLPLRTSILQIMHLICFLHFKLVAELLATLERLGLIPRDRKANCEASSRKLALPPPMEALLGPEKYGCPTSGPPKGRPITDRAGNRVSTKIPSGPVPDGPVLPLDAGDNHSLSLDDLLKAKQKQKQKQAALTSGR